METLQQTFARTGSLHHAYLLEGDRESVREKLFSFLESAVGHPTQGNPDFWHGVFDVFAIDDARALKERLTLKPVVYPRKIFVLETLGMTVEAQNALLKIFEEPSVGTHFFLVTISAETLLPTLRSRVVTLSSGVRSREGKKAAQAFLEASPQERLGLVSHIIEEKNRAQSLELLDGIIAEYACKKESMEPSVMHELLSMRSFLTDRSPSLKLILEHLAFVV